MKKIFILVLLVILSACGDDIPTDYKPENVLEAILLVGEPIQNIAVLQTQPVTAKYNQYKAFIKDAEVKVIGDGQIFPLVFNFDTLKPGYFYPDKNYLIKPATEYRVEVRLKDGTLLTGTTTTPTEISWQTRVKKQLQYPKDTINLPQSDTISWTWANGYDYYIIAITCLDTLEYGKYLTPPTAEKNRRVYNPFIRDFRYKEQSGSGLLPATKTRIVWSAFKWFGLHEVAVMAADWNLVRWYLQNVGVNAVNPLLGSVEGGIGVVGSAYAIRDTFFLLKNQP
jgi:hypothetical protein